MNVAMCKRSFSKLKLIIKLLKVNNGTGSNIENGYFIHWTYIGKYFRYERVHWRLLEKKLGKSQFKYYCCYVFYNIIYFHCIFYCISKTVELINSFYYSEYLYFLVSNLIVFILRILLESMFLKECRLCTNKYSL